MLAFLDQVVAVTLMNLRALKERAASSLVAIVGIAGVVLVLVAVLSIAEGFRATLTSAGSPDTALVLRAGSDTEMTSGLTLEDTKIIADSPEVLRDEQGAVASAELFVIIALPKISTGTDANVPLRGVQPAAFSVREDLRIVEGRNFEPGRNEVIVGQGAQGQFAGLGVGDLIELGQAQWTVVGVFTTGGTIADSELWCDAKVLQPAYRRGNSFQSVYSKLKSPEAFEAFKDALTSDARLNVKVMRETDYYAGQSTILITLIRTLGILIAILMGLGAVFGALITMYTAVASRTREIATLRAIGFASMPVLISVMAEALLLAVVGGLLGAGLSFLVFNGYQAATMNWQTFSQVTFAFAVTPKLMILGFLYSLALGFVGGFFPALAAARLPVATALREA
ncbi:MAG: ABC transporter permease [Deltaproteobacteria bacterium]|nr:ABC transporter permease [Deltaproteobacteria bacterium]